MNEFAVSAVPRSDRAMSEAERQQYGTIFFRDHEADVTQLAMLLPETSSYNTMFLCCCCNYLQGKDWKSVIDRSSIVILHHSYTPETPLPDLSDLEEFLEYYREKQGSGNTKTLQVMITDVKDDNSKMQITESWKERGFQEWELLSPSEAKIHRNLQGQEDEVPTSERQEDEATKFKSQEDEVTTSKAKRFYEVRMPPWAKEFVASKAKRFNEVRMPPWVEKFMPSKFQSSKPRIVGIFSRSSEEEYAWLREKLEPQYTEVRSFYISNNRFHHFMGEVSQCTFGILYHSKNRGRVNVTDVTDSLYDEELEYMSDKLGKENVWVVIDDLDDNSGEVKQQLLGSQQKIPNLAKDLYLIKHGNAEQKVRDLKHNNPQPFS